MNKEIVFELIDEEAKIGSITKKAEAKLAELKKEFEENGLNADNSELFYAIKKSFDSLINYSYKMAKRYIDWKSDLTIINPKDFDYAKTIRDYRIHRDYTLKKYKIFSELISNFTIEDDLKDLFSHTMLTLGNSQMLDTVPEYIEKYVNPLNMIKDSFIENCNIELHQLECDDQHIFHRYYDYENNRDLLLARKNRTLFNSDRELVEELFTSVTELESGYNYPELHDSFVIRTELLFNDYSKAMRSYEIEEAKEIRDKIVKPVREELFSEMLNYLENKEELERRQRNADFETTFKYFFGEIPDKDVVKVR